MSTSVNNFASSSYFNPQDSYIYTSLTPDNLFKSQLGYGLGSSLILNNNEYINYMHHGRPMYDLSQTRSNLLPMGGSLGSSSGMLPLNEERRSVLATSEFPRVGQYGTPNDVLGMNSNLGTGYMRNNYAGISIDANETMGGLGGARVNGNGNSSLGESFRAMNWNFNNNNISNHGVSTSRVPSTFSSFLANEGQPQTDGGAPRSIFGTSQASQVPRFGQYGTTNDVLGMNVDRSTGYMHGNYNGINTNDYGDLVGLGGARVNGNVNGFLGEDVGTMNWNFNNNMSNQGSSTSRFSSPFSSFFVNEDQSQSNLNAQTDGLVPVLENPTMCNDHHDIGNTINSQFDQNQVA